MTIKILVFSQRALFSLYFASRRRRRGDGESDSSQSANQTDVTHHPHSLKFDFLHCSPSNAIQMHTYVFDFIFYKKVNFKI
jgi:hypothetical protein